MNSKSVKGNTTLRSLLGNQWTFRSDRGYNSKMYDIVTIEEIDRVFNLRYFNLVKILQKLSGLWPYYSSWWKIFIKIMFYLVLFISMIPLCNGCRIWCGHDLDMCGENLLGITLIVIIYTKYLNVLFSEKKLKMLYERLVKNWLLITDPHEHNIIVHHAKMGRMYSIVVIVSVSAAGIGFTQGPAIPCVLDFFFPLNESRQRILFVKAEFIIDPYEHFSKLYVFFVIAATVTAFNFASIDCMFCTMIFQCLGLISIVKRRLDVATQLANGEQDNSYKNIVYAIALHQESILFVKLIEASFSLSFLVIVVGTTIFFSTGVVLLLNGQSSIDFVRFAPLETAAMVQILYLSLTAQHLIDYSNDLRTAIYMTRWYKVSAKSKKLLKLIILRTSQPCFVSAGGFYIMNIQNFGLMVKTIVSYITVLTSFRQT